MKVREKMAIYGVETLSNNELLSVLLSGVDTPKIATDMLEKLPHKNIYDLWEIDMLELKSFHSIGKRNAEVLCTA